MKTKSIAAVFSILFCFITSGCMYEKKSDQQVSGFNQTEELHIGFAKINITPPVGMRLCGTFDEKVSIGVHDSLWARAFVFKQGATRFVIAGCDLAMVFPEVCDSVRARVSSSDLPGDHILIHGSETHNGPDYFGEFRDVFHQRAVKRYGFDAAEPIDYSAFLIEKISEAIQEADKALAPSDMFFSSGECEGIAFYRRFRMKDGSVSWNPGKMNPNIVEPLGPTDGTVPVLSIHKKDDVEPSALLTGFAMHLAILEDGYYSADYPYYLDQKLKSQLSSDLFTHFLQPPCCEVNHIDVSTDVPQTGYPWAQFVGEKLAGSVEEALKGEVDPIQSELKVRSKVIHLELQQFEQDELIAQRKTWHSPKRSDLHFLKVVYAGKVASIYDRHQGGPVPILIQTFQLGDEMVLIGLPSEVSIELGLQIQEQSPYRNTMIVQLSNDWLGYIPTERIFEEGHYEEVVAKIIPGEGERLVAETITLLNSLKQDER